MDSTLPSNLKIRKPCLLYTYLPPIRNKIFNYNEVLDDIDNYKNIKSNCSNNGYCNEQIGHVITGDLNFVKDTNTRTLFSYGPSHRIPKSNNWDKIYQNIRNSINDCITTWSNKEHIDRRVLNEWKSSFLTHLSNKITKLTNTYDNNTPSKMLPNKPMRYKIRKMSKNKKQCMLILK